MDNNSCQTRTPCPHHRELIGERVRSGDSLINMPKIDRVGLSCGKCGLEENLWLCLYCGNVGCGRAQVGIRGNGHALRHFEKSKHPLSLKIGTLSDTADPDVYCYACDDAVTIGRGAESKALLIPFGLDVAGRATEQTIAELELDRSLAISLVSLLEGGERLPTLRGPGYRGLTNIGNTCYASAAVQAVATVLRLAGRMPSMDDRYMHFLECERPPLTCITCQEFRLWDGLDFVPIDLTPAEEKHFAPHCGGILPVAAPHLALEEERGRQQDSAEFLLNWLSRSPLFGSPGTVRKEVRCTNCGGAIFSQEDMERIVQIPLEGHPDGVGLMELLAATFAPNAAEGRRCGFCSGRSGIDECIVGSSMQVLQAPEVLIIQPLRATLGPQFTPIKLETKIDVPEILDLMEFVAHEPGVPGSEHAWALVGSDAEYEHEFNGPRHDEGALMMLMEFGVADRTTCIRALLAFDNNIELAANALLTGDIPPPAAAAGPTSIMSNRSEQETVRRMLFEGPAPIYQLVAFVIHQGPHANSGHYVCLGRPNPATFTQALPLEDEEGFDEEQRAQYQEAQRHPDNAWLVFNDLKVAVSQMPHFELGSLFFYKRIG